MNRRQAATAEAVRLIDMLVPGSANTKLIKEQLDRFTDAEFGAYMEKLASGEEILPFISPNLDAKKLSVKRNLQIAETLGHKFFERVWLTDAASGTTYLTPIPYLIVDLPLRRQQQLLAKKIKIPLDTRHIDELTGQPRDESKGSSVSFPEVQVMSAQDYDRVLEELMKFRGGDEKARQKFERAILMTGHASQDAVKREVNSRPKSTETFSVLLKGMHLDNNL